MAPARRTKRIAVVVGTVCLAFFSFKGGACLIPLAIGEHIYTKLTRPSLSANDVEATARLRKQFPAGSSTSSVSAGMRALSFECEPYRMGLPVDENSRRAIGVSRPPEDHGGPPDELYCSRTDPGLPCEPRWIATFRESSGIIGDLKVVTGDICL